MDYNVSRVVDSIQSFFDRWEDSHIFRDHLMVSSTKVRIIIFLFDVAIDIFDRYSRNEWFIGDSENRHKVENINDYMLLEHTAIGWVISGKYMDDMVAKNTVTKYKSLRILPLPIAEEIWRNFDNSGIFC